jgi:hypothetical protein
MGCLCVDGGRLGSPDWMTVVIGAVSRESR